MKLKAFIPILSYHSIWDGSFIVDFTKTIYEIAAKCHCTVDLNMNVAPILWEV